ncbi:MAG: radical SAM protein [Pirellulales bacterium]|nr:radical SAM protein [Pirellulales bacterium]
MNVETGGSAVDVVLVYPPGRRLDYQLSLPSLAAVVREAGYSVKIIDATAEDLDLLACCERVQAHGPRIIGVSIPFTNFADSAVALLEQLRKDQPDAILLCGGVHVTLLPEEIAPHCDAVVLGDGEETLLDLLNEVDGGRPSEFSTKGIAYWKDGRIVRTEQRPLPDLNVLPPPAWDLVPLQYYHMTLPFDAKRRAMPIAGSRGCPYSCTYCCNWILSRKRVRFKDVDKLIDEIRSYKTRYGVDAFLFRDEVFTLKRSRVMELCERIIKEDLNIRWWCQTRAGLVDDEMLNVMKRAGCTSISIGVESGSEEILRSIKKAIKLDAVKDTLERIRKAGLGSYAGFMVGHDRDTPETILETMKRADELDPDYLSYSIATPYPGTELRERALETGEITARTWAEYGQAGATYVPAGLKGYDLRRIQVLATVNFFGQSLRRISRYARRYPLHALIHAPGLALMYVRSKIGKPYPVDFNSRWYAVADLLPIIRSLKVNGRRKHPRVDREQAAAERSAPQGGGSLKQHRAKDARLGELRQHDRPRGSVRRRV